VPLDPSDSRFRPLLSAAAVPEDDAVLVVLSDREVRIGGSPRQAGRILALLDGTRTVAEVADSAELPAEEVQDLLGSLAEQGAVVDCVDAWRRFQRESSIDSGLFRALDDESLERVRLSRFEPPSGDRVLLSPQPTSVRQIVELRESGSVRSIGVSNFQADHLARIVDETGVTPSVNQVELHPYLQQAELRREHAGRGIVTQAWSPLAQGKVLDDQVIVDIGAAHGKSAGQVVLRWHLQLGNVVFPKSATPERIQANFDIFDFSLTEEEMSAIEGLDRGERIGPDPDTFVAP